MSAADDLRALSAAATPGTWRANPEQSSPLRLHVRFGGGMGGLRIGGLHDDADAELIVWLRNHADALADLADTVKAIPRHYPYDGPEVEDVTGKCLVCGTSWPCPTERAHRALAALEATDG